MSETQRIALVTGGSRGIGRAICVALGGLGWRVALNYARNRDAADETAKQIKAAGGQTITLRGDISKAEERDGLVTGVLGAWGRIDLLVNNAGVAPAQRADLLEMSESSWDEVLGVDLKGPFFLTQAVARQMITQGGGMIINIGSISAYTASINRGEYCIAKAGMGMMTALFAERLAPHGIPVYELRPGIIATDMTAGVQAKYDTLIAGGLTPLQRWGKPEDVARAVLMLAAGSLPFSTGEVINVDGGFHLRRL